MTSIIEQATRDLRTTTRKSKFGSKGTTMRTSNKAKAHVHPYDLNCKTCHGPCILSNFYDNEANFKKFKDMFDPKYHRNIVQKLQEFNFLAASGEEAKTKEMKAETLGYDPESTKFLSQRQKAKMRKLARREEEIKLVEEELVTTELGHEEFREALKLALKQSELGELLRHSHQGNNHKKQNRILVVVEDNVEGTLPMYQPERHVNRPDHRGEKHAIMEFEATQPVFVTDNDREEELLISLMAD